MDSAVQSIVVWSVNIGINDSLKTGAVSASFGHSSGDIKTSRQAITYKLQATR